eukprot:CFRG1883T1
MKVQVRFILIVLTITRFANINGNAIQPFVTVKPRIILDQDLERAEIDDPSQEIISAVCKCDGGAESNGKCFSSMSSAIAKVKDGDVVYIAGSQRIWKPTFLKTSIAIVGVTCENQRASVSVGFNKFASAAFHLNSTNDQSLILRNFDMAPTVKGFLSSAVRSDNWNYIRSLDISGMSFTGFKNSINGSALYLGKIRKVRIRDSKFIGNICSEPRESGGTLYIAKVPEGGYVEIGGLWKGNIAEGVHSEGAGVYILWTKGEVVFTPNAKFINNIACEAPAAEVRVVYPTSRVNFGGYYLGNKAVDRGYGARGGAIRSLLIMSKEVEVSGTFKENESEGKGGVYCVNRLSQTAAIHLSGTFINNKAAKYGGVLAADWGVKGTVTISENATFINNVSSASSKRSIIQFRICGLCSFKSRYDQTLGQEEWDENGPKSFRFEGGFPPSMFEEVRDSLTDDDKPWIENIYKPKAWDMFINEDIDAPDIE